MRGFKGLLASVVMMGAFGTANAVPYTWVDYINFIPDEKITNNESFPYTHNILGEGYTPFVDRIDGYSLAVDLYDDGDKEKETALVRVPNLFSNQGNQTFFSLSGSEFGGWSLLGWLQLTLTGELDVTITSKRGDFYLGSSTLSVWGDDRGHAVPEPGTLGLMGLGLLGAAGAARRKKKI